MSFEKVRSDFPQLTQKRQRRALVYLDSAATALKPWPVIQSLSEFYSYEVANVHRSAHYLSDQATRKFEHTREKVAEFIQAFSSQEVVFTKGTTEGINLVASTWGEKNIQSGDEILVTALEHHSNFVPWQNLAKLKQASLVVAPVDVDGVLHEEDVLCRLGPRVKLLAITQMSNVTGQKPDLRTLIAAAKERGIRVLVDGAQWVANHPTSVRELGCDFYVFSAHKLFGPTGLGVLWGSQELLNSLPPYQFGGSMIDSVSVQGTTYLSSPQRFEAGTPPIAEVIAFAASLQYVQNLGWSLITEHKLKLSRLCRELLLSHPRLRLFGPIQRNEQVETPVFSFEMEGLHAFDLAQILDQQNVALRSGHLCAQPLLEATGAKSFLRASISIYNNEQDLLLFSEALQKAQEMLS
ncbi:MAG: SufS family cysteine desulfurase [Bdellovibrio sp.]